MRIAAVYRCPKCGTEYRPLDAGDRRFFCCGVTLERVERRRNSVPSPQRSERPAFVSASALTSSHQQLNELIEVIPPRETMVDALAVGRLLSSFSIGALFSLEIAGDHQSRRLLVRGTPEGVAHIRRQLQATYDQVSFRDPSAEEDPAQPSNLPTVCAQLTLARPCYLPIRTFEEGDFLQDDPVKGLLSALDGMEAGERALTQLILTPAPSQWSRRYEGSARQVEKSMVGDAMSLGLVVRQFASVITVMTAAAFGLWAILSFIQKAWLTFFFASILFSFAAYGVMWLYSLISEQSNVDPKLVQTKIAAPAYDANIWLFVVGRTQERAERKLREIVAAYRRLNLQSGNSFVGRFVEFDPRVLSPDRPSIWDELTARITRLSVNELAGLWHLPVGAEVPGVERMLAKRILPLPANVQQGILVGHSIHQGRKIPVHLQEEALWHHIFMVAKTQKGKSTLMAHLAAAAMQRDTAVVVIDPHGDLARSMLRLVPRSRMGDVIYIDFSDAQQVVGLNLLDMAQGRNADTIVSNIVHVGELIWSDYWGPRMEDALRMALRSFLIVNEKLVQEHERQFTLIDIPQLFEMDNFRHRVFKEYVKDPEVLHWWIGYYENLYPNLRVDVINPVLTKINRFSTHSVVKNIVGQSRSTVDFRELLNERRILLVNTATGVIGPDAGGLLGAVLIDHINFAVREQMAIANPAARARVVVVVDEFQSIPGVDYPGFLAELQKMGASFILATQALGQLEAISEVLRPAILSNIETLFVFQTSADDADVLRHELDDEVTATDIINLADHSCYVKAQVGRDRLPVMHVETLPPQVGDRAIAEQVIGQMSRYARPVKVVEAERKAFLDRWFGREINNTLREVQDSADGARSGKTPKTDKPDKDKKGNKSAQSGIEGPTTVVPPKDTPPGETPDTRPADQTQRGSGTTTGSDRQPPDVTVSDKSAKQFPDEPPSEPPAPDERMNP
jgi:hypothetical protein